MSSTNSTDGARSHARDQAATARMRVPTSPDAADGTTWAEVVPAGSYATAVLGRGTRLRLPTPTVARARTCCSSAPAPPWERLNVADTMKVPWQAYLGVGPSAAVRSGPGAGDRRRRHLGPPRHAVRHDRCRPRPDAARRAQARHGRPRRRAIRVVLQGRPRRRRRRVHLHRIGGRGQRRSTCWSTCPSWSSSSTPPTRSTPPLRSPISTWSPGGPPAS